MNITLIGMSGAGKSTVGKRLAKLLNYSFLDIDRKMESDSNLNLKIPALLKRLGKKKFLEFEEKTITGLGDFDNLVISTGGSAVYSERAMNFLKKRSKIVFLDSSLEVVKKHIPDFSERGVVGLEIGLEALFYKRRLLYEKYGDIMIEVKKGFKLEKIVEELIDKIKEKVKLKIQISFT